MLCTCYSTLRSSEALFSSTKTKQREFNQREKKTIKIERRRRGIGVAWNSNINHSYLQSGGEYWGRRRQASSPAIGEEEVELRAFVGPSDSSPFPVIAAKFGSDLKRPLPARELRREALFCWIGYVWRRRS
ncbi:unnamed protein product [Linum tenue]|uniref:Uncharacterized protein n=1 Tax=Linum tenue TaxID=586396 RepID=A0AAV0MRB4_9ROSI|nr:unnamed protein product [Linum tenue]